jgi:hypothetical protein
VADTAIAADVHETFDVKLDFAAEVTLNFVFSADHFTHFSCLIIGPIFNFDVNVNASFSENVFSCAATDAKDVSQGDFTSFVLGEVNSHDSYCHIFLLNYIAKIIKIILDVFCTWDFFY